MENAHFADGYQEIQLVGEDYPREEHDEADYGSVFEIRYLDFAGSEFDSPADC